MADTASILWKPSAKQIAEAQLTLFAQQFLSSLPEPFSADYRSLHRASVIYAAEFWRAVWKFCKVDGVLGSIDYVAEKRLPDGRWFPGGSVNFASVLLQVNRLSNLEFAQSTAIIAKNEAGEMKTWSRQSLYDEVRAVAKHFHHQGVLPGDRIAAVVPNIGEAVVAMLAATSLGAIWSSCSPEFGEDAICDRFGQIEPKILITTAEAQYNHKTIRPVDRVLGILPRLPTLRQMIVIGSGSGNGLERTFPGAGSVCCKFWDELIAQAAIDDPNIDLDFQAAFLRAHPFNHPLYIVYSSGTTGIPKCIVHGVGGTILQHLKEHRLHCDLRAGDRLFYYTTTGWMMWNWLVSGLASGATIVLQDGSPLVDGPSMLWATIEQLEVTHFGAGAKYYSTLQKEGYVPKEQFDLSSLRCIMSTGSPLLGDTFDWIYSTTRPDLNLASISGGTDILSCFVLGNPTLPVIRGEIQCAGLGMDVQVFDPEGKPIENQPGELVCVNSFPSMPIGFWNDVDGQKYQRAYFEQFPNVWCHGDWATRTSAGGFVIHGRSDATLNPGGVRIGTAEIYQQLESFDEILESLATVVRQDGDEQILLFIRLRDGYDLNDELATRIRKKVRARCSARHVPALIAAAPDFPKTISGKVSEIAVRNAIAGSSLGNAGALANPQSLRFFETWSVDKAI